MILAVRNCALSLPLFLSAPIFVQCGEEVLLETVDAGVVGLTLTTPDGAPVLKGPFSLRTEGGAPLAPGPLGVGFADAPQFLPAFGANFFPATPFLSIPFATDAAGASPELIDLGFVDEQLCGMLLIAQGAVIDASATGGAGVTNALRMRAGVAKAPILPGVQFDAGFNPNAMVARDFDSDGKTDLVVVNGSPDLLSFLPGDGDGGFGAPQAVSAGVVIPTRLASDDLDGDGRLDLIVGAAGPPFLPGDTHAALGNGDGTFGALQLVEAGLNPYDPELGDVNGDGVLDLLVPDEGLDDVAVHVGVGDGTFLPSSHYGVSGSVRAVAAADFDVDGKLDLVLPADSSFGTDTLETLSGNGDGTFVPGTTLGGVADPRDVKAVDLNLDGLPDVISSNTSSSLAVYLGNGTGTFLGPALPGSSSTFEIVLDDFDDDGFVDAAGIGSVDRLTFLAGKGDGTFGAVKTSPATMGAQWLVAARFDANASVDLAYLTGVDVSGVQVLLGDGKGGFGSWQVIDDGGAFDLSDVELRDVSGDGIADLVSVGHSSKAVVALGAGDGTFLPATTYATGGLKSPLAVAIGDLNADGSAELVMANDTTTVTRLEGLGGGAFGAPFTYAAGGSTYDVELADLDGDGNLDAVTANWFNHEAAVLTGNGFLDLALQATYPTGLTPRSVAIEDFNLDGALDFATGNSYSGTISSYLNDGTAAFSLADTVPAPTGARDVAARDFTGDGIVDLATSGLSMVVGNGDGTFAPGTTLATGNGRSVLLDDLDGDGRTDAAVVDQDTYDLWFYPGNGDGTFDPVTRFAVGRLPTALDAGDVDGDGIPDVAVSLKSDGISVLISRIGEPSGP